MGMMGGMRDLLFRWQENYIRPPRWMGFAYYAIERNQNLFVIYPLHFVVAGVWWVQDRWARHTFNPSWIDREVNARTNRQLSSGEGRGRAGSPFHF